MTSILPVAKEKLPSAAQTQEEFDPTSGTLGERLIFNNRHLIVVVCAVLTIIFGWSASRLEVNASYTNMLPAKQQFVINYERNRDGMQALSDSVRVIVENTDGTIYNPHYLSVLRQLNDSVFLLPGVDRSFMTSLWMPTVQWTQITEAGSTGGPVMPDTYDGSPAAIDQLRQNIQQAGITGSVVANDQKSSIIFIPLLDIDPATGKTFNYGKFWSSLQALKTQLQSQSVHIHIVGFAAIMGNLLIALHQILFFFLMAAVIAGLFIFAFTRCWRSTLIIIACSLVAVIWLLGIIHFLGYVLDPYSVLVPFLVFAIGVSHGTQKMNGIMQDVGRGVHRYVAARYTFRRLFVAGFTALVADAVGFAVLTVIQITAIRDLAITASIGVSMLVFTNLMLLPVILSFTGVSQKAAQRSLAAQDDDIEDRGAIAKVFDLLEHFTSRRWAVAAVSGAVLLAVVGYSIGRNVQIGDVNPGAPELRPNSIYNQDNAFVISHYSLSSDQFAIIVRGLGSDGRGLVNYRAIVEMDRLGQIMRSVPGVQTTASAADYVRDFTAAQFEGNLKWWTINRQTEVLSNAIDSTYANHPDMMSADFSAAPVIIYLYNHKANTLDRVAKAAQGFAGANSSPNAEFLLAAGNAGFDAATNIVVAYANEIMPYLVYGAVIILCLVSFRTWRAVIVAVVPLVITSILCQALMVMLGIGIKVATLPVIALGVGIGVDYALYLLSVQLAFQRAGDPLNIAYRKALRFTGRIVALVGVTLAVGVVFWIFSPIKFQADMGVLLTFMFLWNMIGALVLVPALSYFLLPTRTVFRGPPQDGDLVDTVQAH